MTPELQSKMILWRAKCNDKTITEAELTEAMAALRGERRASAVTAKERTAKAKAVKAAIPSAEDLLSEIDDMEGDK